MPRRQLLPHKHRRGGQGDGTLRHPAARVGLDLDPQLGQFPLGGVRPDHDARAARAVDRLEHQAGQLGQHPVEGFRVVEPVGLDVVEQRFLAQVVADEIGHVGVDELVVRHPVADAVGDRHGAVPRRVDQAGAAEQAVRAEVQRVEPVVVDPPVNDVDGAPAVRGVHVDAVAPAEQVAALDELHAHQPGEHGVLEVGGVVHAGGEHDDERVEHAVRRGRAERGEQPGGVLIDLVHLLLGEQGGERPCHRQPVLDHVADTARHPHVVLEDAELAEFVADQVDARHVHPDAVGRRDAGHLAAELLAGEHQPPGHHAVVEAAASAVDVGEEGLEREHALLHSPGHLVPLQGADDPRDQVERERPLLARVVVGDAPVGEHPGQLVRAVAQLRRVHRLKHADQRVIARAGLAGGREHLVPGFRQPVPIENVRHDHQPREMLFHLDFST